MEIFPLFSAGSGSELLGAWQYLVGAERFGLLNHAILWSSAMPVS